MRVTRTRSIAIAAGAVALVLAGSAPSGAASGQDVRLLDDCEPTSFNAFLDPDGVQDPPPCIGDGGTTVAEFGEELQATGVVAKWRNNPRVAEYDHGSAVRVENRGGELHTLTRVAQFGGGVVPELNAPGQDAAPECTEPPSVHNLFVPAGESATLHLHAPGGTSVQRYQCCIHPWMRSTLTVRED